LPGISYVRELTRRYRVTVLTSSKPESWLLRQSRRVPLLLGNCWSQGSRPS